MPLRHADGVMAQINTVSLVLATFAHLTLTLGQDLIFTITEESGSDKLVGSVSNVTLNSSLADRVSLSYFFLTASDIANIFRLEDTNGMLYTKVNIDREAVCRNYLPTHVCSLTVKIGAKTAQDFKSIDVKIIVNDINDNAPTFPTANITVRISEGVTLNTSFPIPSAEDLDTGGTNGVQSYEINPTSDTFNLVTTTNLAGSLEVKLVVIQSLDREIQDAYVIHIVAKDGGSPARTGSLIVTIVIDDINDNRPIFDKNEYSISVAEWLVCTSFVLNIHANDNDIGKNGLVSYRISDRFIQALSDFTVNVSTGDVRVLKSKIVFQSDFHYSFIIEAYDNGEQPQISQVWVYIYVLDTENSPPEIIASFPNADNVGHVTVFENSVIGTFVAHIFVTDPDTGVNGFITCKSLNNYFDAIKFSDAGEFKVIVKNSLDREVFDKHNVTIVCSDNGTPVLNASVSFSVRISDCNDNKPVFNQPSYSAQIPENTMAEKTILQVSASDKDLGKNQEIRYEVRNQDKIVVNAVTGIVSVKPLYDREVTPVVVFEVLAIDGGDVSLTGTATITLSIQDVNDNVPAFSQSQYFFEIEENLSSGTTINHLSANDLDISANGKFTFAISHGQTSSKLPFVILPDGSILSNQALDREEQSQYCFNASVTDQGNQPLSISVPVTIFVTDVNDNEPNITFPRKGNQTVSVLYPSGQMDLVTALEASDLDFQENGTLQYSILKGNELGLFKLESSSGKMFLAKNYKAIYHDTSFSLLIAVKDSGKVISRSSTANLIVNVICVNSTNDFQIGEHKKFTNIVVIVVVVTVILSGILIAIILLVRTWDKKRKQQDNSKVLGKSIYNRKPGLFFLNDNVQSSTEFSNTTTNDGKKIKEISLDLDDQDSFKCFYPIDLQVNLSLDPFKYTQEKVGADSRPTLELRYKDRGRPESLNIQKMHLESHNRQEHKQQQQQQQIHHIIHGNPDDSQSELSGETSIGDSGRGTSEEDMPSTSPIHGHQMFEYVFQYQKLKNQAVPAKTDIYNQMPPAVPCRSYKLYSSFHNNNNNNNNNQKHSTKKQYLNVSLHHSSDQNVFDTNQAWRSLHHRSQYPLTLRNVVQSDFPVLSMINSQHHSRPREHDECSTTTSGSYTLHTLDDLL